ncbi:MAG: hypothetical protein ACRYGL_04470, partial [Janthinobacterium lividum]
MSALTFGAKVGLVANSFALNVLNQSSTLNRFVNWITDAHVNREVLAERVWHAAINLLQEWPVGAQSLGERSATLVPLLTTALIKGNREETRQAIAELTRIGVDNVLGIDASRTAASRVKRALADVAGDAASAISTRLVDRYLGPHAGEKVLATMVARHGWAPIQDRLQHALGTTIGSDFLIRQIKGVLDPAVIEKSGMNQESSPEYRALADLAHIGLTGGGHDAMLARLQDYAPQSFAAVQQAKAGWQATQAFAETIVARVDQTRAIVNDAARLVQETVPALLRTIQAKTGIGLQPQMLDDAYAANAHAMRTGGVEVLATAGFPADVKDRHIADAYLTQWVVARDGDHPAAGAKVPDSRDAASLAMARVKVGLLDLAQATPERFHDAQRLLDTLSPQQIAPLGERSDIAVVKTLTGQLTKIETNSHRWLPNDVSMNQAIDNGLSRLPDDMILLGGYKVGRAFAAQLDSLQLSLPASEYGYADGAWDSGMTAVNAGWRMLGFKTDALPNGAGERLRQLYNTCGRDEEILQEATRYLDASSVISTMA